MLDITPIAAIDIGSNAIRLQITNIERYASETVFKKVSWVRVPLRLGEDVFSAERIITPEKIARLSDTMCGFSFLMKAYNVKHYKACATSAMREALNKCEVAELIHTRCGIDIDIIGGSKEAEIIMQSGLDSIVAGRGCCLFVDVGGGSTELSLFDAGLCVDSRSFPVGTVRMLQGTVGETVIKDMKKWLKFQLLHHSPSIVIGSGGNIAKVSRLLGKKENEVMNYAEMKVLYDYIESFSLEDRIHTLKLNPHRADVIVPALKIFLSVIKSGKINEVLVPKVGMIEGITRSIYEEYKEKI